MSKTIELDCAPGVLRPGHLVAAVVQGTAAAPLVNPDAPVSSFFGNWTWDFSSLSDEEWKEVQKIIKPRIEELYHKGYIRYGSW